MPELLPCDECGDEVTPTRSGICPTCRKIKCRLCQNIWIPKTKEEEGSLCRVCQHDLKLQDPLPGLR